MYWSNLENVIIILLYKSAQNKLLFYCYPYCQSQKRPSYGFIFSGVNHVYKQRFRSSNLYTHTTFLLLCIWSIEKDLQHKRYWFLGIWYLGLGLFVERYNVTLYWLKESILKNQLVFLPHEGFPGYILCLVIVYLSAIPLHAIVNEC